MHFKKILFLFIFELFKTSFTYICLPCICEYEEKSINVSCTTVDVNSNLMIKTIPPFLEKFSDINSINKMDFTGQAFIDLNDNDLKSFINVTILIFRNNTIINIHPSSFKNLKSLKSLYLDNNQIKSLSSELFANNKNIEFIFLNNNRIKLLPKNLFKNLLHLKEVHLNQNFIELIEDSCFVNVPLLQTLDLSSNTLKTLRISFMDNVESLQIAYFDKNPWMCNSTLCDLINHSVRKNWSRGRVTKCYNNIITQNQNWEDLQILEKLKILKFQSSVEINQNVILTCKISACTSPKMLWSFNNRKLVNSTQCSNGNQHTLINELRNITKNNEGWFICSIKNCDYCTNDTRYLTVSNFDFSNTETSTLEAKDYDVGENNLNISFPKLPDICIPEFTCKFCILIGFFIGIFFIIILIPIIIFCCLTRVSSFLYKYSCCAKIINEMNSVSQNNSNSTANDKLMSK